MCEGAENENMLVAQKINNFITDKRPSPICDGCIVEALSLTQNAHSNQVTVALGTTSDFYRRRGVCAICENEKMVTHAQGPTRSEVPG